MPTSETSKPQHCRKCGAALSGYAPDGLCAACLLESAFDVRDAEVGEQSKRAPLLSFSDYELLEEIARGGMGVVYRSRQISLKRIVAIKMILSGHLANSAEMQRFRAEAETAAHLRHPNIVAIHEVGEHAGQPFFSMDMIDGRNLAQLVRDEPLPSRKAAGYLKTIGEAVQYAHSRGVLHRDLKPSNILIDESDQPRITDFGLAKRFGVPPSGGPGAIHRGPAEAGTPNSLTQTGQVLGSPSFIPPEQAAGQKDAIGPASDVYSLGAILYHCLTARPPFVAETMTATLRMVAENEPVSPRLLNVSIPRDLETICLKCLEKDPGRRYAKAQELADDLDRFLRDEPIQARPTGQGEKFWRWCRRNPALASAGAAMVVLLLTMALGSFIATRRIDRERRQAVEARKNEAALRQKTEATNIRLAEALNQLQLEKADELFASGDSSTALAYLARVLRQNLTNEIVGTRLLFALTQRNVAWCSTEPPQRDEQDASDQLKAGETLTTVSGDKTARLWDTKADQPLTEPLKHEAPVRSAPFTPDEQRVVTASYDNTARVWDAKTGQPLTGSLNHRDIVFSAQFSPDGKRVLTASFDMTARLWDAKTGLPVTEPLKHEAAVNSARFSPDGERVVTASEDRTARLWDAKTGLPLTEPLKHDGPVRSAGFSPDGQRIATASSDKTARFWDAKTGQPLTGPLKHEGKVMSAHFSPDSQRLVTASHDQTARVWDAKTGQPLTEPLKHESIVISARFSPDGQRVVTASDDHTARLWDAKTGQPLTEALKHENTVYTAQFSPDGQRVVTASWDKTARLWDAKTGHRLAHPFKHDEGILSAEFSPDGQRVVTASWDSTARVWEVPSVSLPVPAWLPKLAEAIAEKRFTYEGVSESVPPNELLTLKRQLSQNSDLDVWTQCAKWFFADHATRTISPFSAITVPEYVRHRIDENTLNSLQEAVSLAPRNPLALARLSRAVLAQSPDPNPRQVGEADRYIRQALRLGPKEAEAWWARAEFFERAVNLPEALEAMKAALEVQPQNPELWNAQGRMLEKTNRNDEAYNSFTKAIELARAKPGSTNQSQAKFYLSRANFLKKQNRLAEAGMDFCLARNIPMRDSKAKPEQLDLTLFYNVSLTETWAGPRPGNDLAAVPRGVQTFAGVAFDVRGLIQVGRESQTGQKYPNEVEDIPVGRNCVRLYFLHAASYGGDVRRQGLEIALTTVSDGTEIGSYVVHYSNGERRDVPIIVGRNVEDWWRPEENPSLVVAWKGTNEDSRRKSRTIGLFKMTWENPSPELAVRSIDFLSKGLSAAPFLVAITVE